MHFFLRLLLLILAVLSLQTPARSQTVYSSLKTLDWINKTVCVGQPARFRFERETNAPPVEITFYLVIGAGSGPRTLKRLGASTKSSDTLTVQTDSSFVPGSSNFLLAEWPGFLYSNQGAGIQVVPLTKPVSMAGEATVYAGDWLQITIDNPSRASVELTDGLNTLQSTNTILYYLPGDARNFQAKASKSTSYIVKEAVGLCNNPATSGQFNVTVLPDTGRTIRFNDFGAFSYDVQGYISSCVGSTFSCGMTPKGTFNPDNVFSVQLSDRFGQNFQTIPTKNLGNDRLSVRFPANIAPGNGYRARVVASSPYTVGSSSLKSFTIKPNSFTPAISSVPSILQGQSTALTVSAGRYFVLNDGQTDKAYSNTGEVLVKPDTTTTYRLVYSNIGGCETLNPTAKITIQVVPLRTTDAPVSVVVAPNPTSGLLRISAAPNTNRPEKPVTVTLHDIQGRLVKTWYLSYITTTMPALLDLSTYAASQYLLTIGDETGQTTVRVLKQ
jgi:hypothetical protein